MLGFELLHSVASGAYDTPSLQAEVAVYSCIKFVVFSICRLLCIECGDNVDVNV